MEERVVDGEKDKAIARQHLAATRKGGNNQDSLSPLGSFAKNCRVSSLGALGVVCCSELMGVR
jgi:hypothetical protein